MQAHWSDPPCTLGHRAPSAAPLLITPCRAVVRREQESQFKSHQDDLFDVLALRGDREALGGHRLGDDHDAVIVAHDEVSGADDGPADVDHLVDACGRPVYDTPRQAPKAHQSARSIEQRSIDHATPHGGAA